MCDNDTCGGCVSCLLIRARHERDKATEEANSLRHKLNEARFAIKRVAAEASIMNDIMNSFLGQLDAERREKTL